MYLKVIKGEHVQAKCLKSAQWMFQICTIINISIIIDFILLFKLVIHNNPLQDNFTSLDSKIQKMDTPL
jgi:hypothetical protein